MSAAQNRNNRAICRDIEHWINRVAAADRWVSEITPAESMRAGEWERQSVRQAETYAATKDLRK